VLSSQLLPSSELRALLFILDLWCLKVREQKRFHFLREDGDLADPSQLECSSWTSSVVASWIVFRLKHSGHQCWGGRYLNIWIRSLNMCERENSKLVQVQWWRERRLRISHILLKLPKLWIPLHVPLRPLL
jgi:hypothetical protein